MIKNRFIFPKPFIGDGDPDPGAPPPGEPVTPPVKPFDPDAIDERFESNSDEPVNITQAQLSRIIGGIRVGMRKKNDELSQQIAELANKANITKEERDRLNNLLEQSRSNFQTELERTQSDHTRLQEAHNKLQKEAEKREETWRKRFEQTLIDQQVSSACEENDVYSARQIRDMLDRHLTVAPVLDQKGEPTEEFIVAVRTTNDEKETVNLPITDYVKKMRESGSHPNLFKHSLKEGLGANNGNGGGNAPINPKDLESLQKILGDPDQRKAFLSKKIGTV